MKKTLIGSLIAIAFIPVAVSALSVSDIQAQIQALLARVGELRMQLQTAQGSSATTPIGIVDISRPRVCDFIERRLAVGSSGDEVRALQEFLAKEGVFNREPTGYFGSVTGEALRSWQVREGIVSSASSGGVFGERSREFLMRRCGGGGSSVFSASPRRGSAPLSVTFYANVGGMRPFSTRYEIDFGDGTRSPAPECSAPADVCIRPGELAHTYALNGTYIATLTRISDPCDGNPLCMAPVSTEVLGKIEIVVGGTAGCTLEYAPVCGAKPIVCITTPCNPVPTTYGNRCAMNADGATFLYEGACRSDVIHPEKDPQCKRWTDGAYCGSTCHRDTVGGTPICMIPMCAYIDPVPPNGPARCLEYFSGTNRAPNVSGFSGPTSLAVNETGTWTIRASDPENQSLTYSVDWGETFSTAASLSAVMDRSFVQTTTFTHAYAYPGTYTVTITVRDAAGQTAQTSTTVRVGGSTLSCYSGGTSYPEGTRRSCIEQNGMTTCLADATHVCRSGSWITEGTYPPPVACTMDARMCPDGSYVGRTGPSCQFVCPGGVLLN